MPAGTVISTRGNGLYAEETLRLFDLGLLNSWTADSLIKLSLGRGGHPQFDMGDLSSIPVPLPDATVSGLANRAWSLKRSLDTRTDASHAFTLPAWLQVGGDTLIAPASAWAEHVRTIEAQVVALRSGQRSITAPSNSRASARPTGARSWKVLVVVAVIELKVEKGRTRLTNLALTMSEAMRIRSS
jgi:hypothetical protein